MFKHMQRIQRGEAVGTQVSFNTLPVLPTVSTILPTAIATTFCIISGNVNNNGGADIIEKGNLLWFIIKSRIYWC